MDSERRARTRQKGRLVVLEARAGSSKRPLAKKGPWWFWSVGRGVLQEAPGQKGSLVALEARAGFSKRHLVKKGPWWFWRVWGAILQEAPGQKGPLMVLERRARGPPRGPWPKRPLVVLEARAGSSKRPLAKKGPWWLWRPGRGPPRGHWPKRAPDGFGGQGAHPLRDYKSLFVVMRCDSFSVEHEARAFAWAPTCVGEP